MTRHIEEARKVWGYFKGGSAGGTEAMQWFDNNKSCGGPAYLIEVFRAALAAAEERGRIEERGRLVEIVKRRMAVYQTKESASDFLQEPSNSDWDMYRYTREAHEWLLAAISKEPTP